MSNNKNKDICIKMYNDGISVKDICDKYDVPKSTMYYWIKQSNPIKSSSSNTVTMQEYTFMHRRIERLEQENQIYKLSGCTVSAPLKNKLQEIKRLKDQFSIHALCDVLQVRRSTFYYYLYRSPEITQLERSDAYFRPLIADIFESSQQRFGAKKIKVKLNKEGHQISARRIQRLMYEMNLTCNRKKPPRVFRPEKERQYYRNKLNREFKQSAPNRAWVSDITYYNADGKKQYICVVIDLFSRKVLACDVSVAVTASVVSATFYEAFIHRNQPENLMFHSDMGSQYTSKAFQKRLRDLGVDQSFSKPGCPYDNAVVESFFASLKKEELHRTDYENTTQLRAAVEAYIEFFNHDRPHMSLNFLTPDEYEQQYFGT